MTDINNPDIKEVSVQTEPRSTSRQVEVQTNKNAWSGLTHEDIVKQLGKLNFIVDQWGYLSDYADLVLPEGWELVTTSKSANSLGTVTIHSSESRNLYLVQRAIKTYVANHGIRLSQADTFIETLYYAKYLILPLLTTVLDDQALYRAYRTYSREGSVSEYLKWVRDHNLQHCQFNLTLQPSERVRLSEMLCRMTYADVALRPKREEIRKRLANKNTSA